MTYINFDQFESNNKFYFFVLKNVSKNVACKMWTIFEGTNIKNSIMTWNSVHVADDSNINC